MIVGNSVAYYLGAEGFTPLDQASHSVTLNAGAPACVFPRSERLRFTDFGNGVAAAPCDASWREQLRTFRPDLVIVTFSDTGSGEMLHDGRWLAPCDPGYRDWYLGALERDVRNMRAVHARVVLTTSAYSTGFGLADAARVASDCTNALIREFARTHPGVVLVDLERFVCPTPAGACRRTIAGAELRPDGVHYRNASARRIARWILDRVDAATRDAADGPSARPAG